MQKQLGRSAFPGIFLAFSVLLLVLAVGFVVGRLVVAHAYIKAAPRFEKRVAAEPRMGPTAGSEWGSGVGQVFVPELPQETEEAGSKETPPAAAGMEEETTRESGEQQTPEEPAGPARVEAEQREPVPIGSAESPETADMRYSVQVGVFVAQQGARKVVEELTRAGYPARIEVQREGGRTTYRVLTGRYRTEYAARKAAEQLTQDGFPAFLVAR